MRTSQAMETDSPKLAVVTSSLQNFIDRTLEHNKILAYLIDISTDLNARVFGWGSEGCNDKAEETPNGSVPMMMWLLDHQERQIETLRGQTNNIAALIHHGSAVFVNDPDGKGEPVEESSLAHIEARLIANIEAIHAIDVSLAAFVQHAFDEPQTGPDKVTSTSVAGGGLLSKIDLQLTEERTLLDSVENSLHRLRTIG